MTIDDPLVSRQHAKVVLRGEGAYVEDMSSRNGVRVNGQPVKGPTPLTDGDRIRIGTQELVFCRVTLSQDHATKRTGFLRHCARCRTPYPEEMGACPHCGATDTAEEETLSGAADRQNWTLKLLVEVVQRALTLQRATDAERLMRRATISVDERLDALEPVERAQLDALTICGARLAELQGNAHWIRWGLQAYIKLKATPPALMIEKIPTLPPGERSKLGESLQGILALPPETPDEQTLHARARELLRQLEASS